MQSTQVVMSGGSNLSTPLPPPGGHRGNLAPWPVHLKAVCAPQRTVLTRMQRARSDALVCSVWLAGRLPQTPGGPL